jgi:DNA-directed RNA polymerase specialized sigma24 family protein
VERRRQEFTEFYTACRDDCLRIVLVSVGDRQLAEDLVAEAFTRAWMSWRKVREHPVPLAAAVRALPPRQREVVVLRVFFGLDTSAAAQLLGIAPGTVGAHLHRALGTLRTQRQSFSDQEVPG